MSQVEYDFLLEVKKLKEKLEKETNCDLSSLVDLSEIEDGIQVSSSSSPSNGDVATLPATSEVKKLL